MKNLFRTTLFLLLSALAFYSCNKMEDIHSEYIEGGEIIYANVPDTLQTMSGNGRIQLKWLVFNGNNIQQSVVEWEDQNEMHRQLLNVSLDTPVDSVYFIIDNLDEKSYVFKVYNIDTEGNRSIKKQISGAVYGPIYESTLNNRLISMIEGGGTVDSVVISWHNPAEGYVGTEISYTNSVGEPVRKMLLPEEDKIVIRNWESESEMNYRSFYIPESNAIDTFSTDVDRVMLPMFVVSEKLDKSKFNRVVLPGDADMNAWGMRYESAYDDDPATFNHSYGGIGWPLYFTLDLGVTAHVLRLNVLQRTDSFLGYGAGNPRLFEIWGTAEEPPSDGSWNGWTKLKDCVATKPSLQGGTAQEDQEHLKNGDEYSFTLKNPPVRYIRILVNETWGAVDYIHFAELTFYGQVIR